jgi:sugar phosphate isomerase/epimerase
MKISVFIDFLRAITAQRSKTFEEVLQIAANLGITKVDVQQGHLEWVLENMPLLEKYGITVGSMIARADFLHDPSKAAADRIIESAKMLKTDNILLVPGFWQEGDVEKECILSSLEPMKYIVKKATDDGIAIGFEDYDGETPVSKSENMLWYIENLPGSHCIFDTGNFLYEGEDVLENYKMLKPYITRQVHCKDRALTGRPDEAPSVSKNGFESYPAAVGSGIMPMKEILTDFKESGFDGILTIELFGSKDYMEDIINSVEFLKQNNIV